MSAPIQRDSFDRSTLVTACALDSAHEVVARGAHRSKHRKAPARKESQTLEVFVDSLVRNPSPKTVKAWLDYTTPSAKKHGVVKYDESVVSKVLEIASRLHGLSNVSQAAQTRQLQEGTRAALSMSAEAWEIFESDFKMFCVRHELPEAMMSGNVFSDSRPRLEDTDNKNTIDTRRKF